MTAPTTSKRSNKTEPETATMEDTSSVEETVSPVEETETETVPELLNSNPIFAAMCSRYLDIAKSLAEYNASVLSEKDSEYSPRNLINKAQELGNPTDANVKANEAIKTALNEWEELVIKARQARANLIEVTAKELGIAAPTTVERDPEVEAKLRDDRKTAFEIGTQLKMIVGFTNDQNTTDVVMNFLEQNPLPAVGRDQSRNFAAEAVNTPKYRVTVTAVNGNGDEVVRESGFSKAAQALSKFYDRGQGIKPDALRTVWESAGNTPEKTVQDSVTTEDNGLTITITKK